MAALGRCSPHAPCNGGPSAVVIYKVRPKSCACMCAQDGDLLHLMGIMNKQDYARWHSYEFMLSTRTADASLRPPGHPEVHSCA